MSSHDGILSSHLSYFISSIRSAYVDNFSSVRTKKLPDVQGHISHGYISLLSADWASLKWRAATVYRISNFMAAYGRGRLLTRDTTDQQLTWSPCAWKSVVIRWAAVLTSASVTKINRRGHCQMQYSETRPAPQQCDCMRQWTCYNSTVLEKLRWPTAQTDRRLYLWRQRALAKVHPRLDSRLQRQSWQSFPAMPSPSSSLQSRAITHFASFAAWSAL